MYTCIHYINILMPDSSYLWRSLTIGSLVLSLSSLDK